MTHLPQYWWAVEGQKVECRKVGSWSNEAATPTDEFPRFGDILTIRFVEYDDPEGIFLLFSEIRNPLSCHDDHGEPAESQFLIDRFRPVWPQKRTSDIAQFKSLLTPVREGANA